MANINGTNATQTLNGTSVSDTMRGLGGRDRINGLGGADVILGGDGGDTIFGGDGNDVIYGHSGADLDPNSANITATLLANVGSGAVFVTGAPGDGGFVYALRKDAGEIIRINTGTGANTTFLNIPDGEFSGGGERGVLGLAFHPDYDMNGRFFVFLTKPSSDIEVREYARSAGNPPVASSTVVQSIITIPHSTNTNHNGGSLAFGPDGNLYIATGDGGGADDPGENAQDINSLLGKILRIDVDGDDFPMDSTRNYAIPTGNPFADATAGADEIWDLGLRNPWRISFDPATGDLYIGDVGQGAREEVDFEPAGGQGGRNYGWDYREGTIQGPSDPPVPPIAFVGPVFEYSHDIGHSITGGHVYRGPAAGLQGAYFFADFVSGRLFALRMVNGVAEDAMERTAQIVGADLQQISSFGTDNAGNLYVVSLSGQIRRLSPGAAAGDGADFIDGGAGNDRIFGGWGNDTLSGGIGIDTLNGGVGGDLMRGGAGNDVYFVDNASDTINEAVAGSNGSDTVQASISFSLATSAHVLGSLERLVLLGAANINGIGNALDNALYGNTGANLLAGAGGADVLWGRQGNDTLHGGGGNDTLVGGAGNDTLTGSLGNDRFLFEAPLGNVDRITDFNVIADTMLLENAIFAAIAGTGVLTAHQFTRNASGLAQDLSDRIIYETDTGRLFYDRNGSAIGSSVQFAVLAPNLGVTNADFVVF